MRRCTKMDKYGQLALNTFSYSFTCFLITGTDLKDVLLGLLTHIEANNLDQNITTFWMRRKKLMHKELRLLEIRIFDILGLKKGRFVKIWIFGEWNNEIGVLLRTWRGCKESSPHSTQVWRWLASPVKRVQTPGKYLLKRRFFNKDSNQMNCMHVEPLPLSSNRHIWAF